MITGNLKSEQLLSNGELILDHDQPVRGKNNILNLINKFLVEENVEHFELGGKKVFVYDKNGENETVLLIAAITYMGGNGGVTKHPEYLKRIQIPSWWNKITKAYSNVYQIKYIGIYNYNGVTIFSEVQKETYLKREVNNSSAHIYTNDLLQAMKNGIFQREDRNGNIIISINTENLESYLRNEIIDLKIEFDFLKEFNKFFIDGQTIIAKDAIREMLEGKSRHWREAEWPGWFLEYNFQKFLNKYNYNIVFVEDNKDFKLQNFNHSLDFDLWFVQNNHFADLKSSSNLVTEFLGNDKDSVFQAINEHGKLWYIVYQHDTKLDRDVVGNWDDNYELSQARQRAFILNENNSVNGRFTKEDSYFRRMKHSVKYSGMFVLELNEQNIKHYASNFNQGRQPDGSPRKTKVKFNKNQIENGIVFSYNFHDE